MVATVVDSSVIVICLLFWNLIIGSLYQRSFVNIIIILFVHCRIVEQNAQNAQKNHGDGNKTPKIPWPAVFNFPRHIRCVVAIST